MSATKNGWHAIAAFFRCQKEDQLERVRGIVPRGADQQTPEALGVGICFHAARARWFKLGFRTDAKAWAEIQGAVEHEATLERLPISLVAQRRALDYFMRYAEHWAPLPKPRVLMAEQGLEVLLPSPFKTKALGPVHSSRIDDVSRYPEDNYKGVWIGEAKTASQSVAQVVAEYELHGQLLGQILAWNGDKDGAAKHGPVQGVMLDVLKKPYERTRAEFARVPLTFPLHALEWAARNLATQKLAQRDMRWDDDAPRNMGACTRMHGSMRASCPYKDLCKHGKDAAGKYVFTESGKGISTWKPSKGKQVPPWM